MSVLIFRSRANRRQGEGLTGLILVVSLLAAAALVACPSLGQTAADPLGGLALANWDPSSEEAASDAGQAAGKDRTDRGCAQARDAHAQVKPAAGFGRLSGGERSD